MDINFQKLKEEIDKLNADIKEQQRIQNNPTDLERAMQNWSGILPSKYYKKILPLYIHESKENCQCCILNYAF